MNEKCKLNRINKFISDALNRIKQIIALKLYIFTLYDIVSARLSGLNAEKY